jgi:hypothetical protein
VLDLSQRRDLGGILSTCFRLYRAHFLVFASIALAVALPIDVLTVGLADGQLLSDYDGDYAFGGGVAYTVCQFLVTVPLITAGHVIAVRDLGAGAVPTARNSLAAAASDWLPLVVVVLVTAIGVLFGSLALLIPGIYLYTRWYVAAPAVVAEDLGPMAALRRSWALVKGQLWRVFGISIVLGLVAGACGAAFAGPVTLLASALDSGVLAVLGTVLADAVVLSYTALGSTLLYFDLRARRDVEAQIDRIGVSGPEDPRAPGPVP